MKNLDNIKSVVFDEITDKYLTGHLEVKSLNVDREGKALKISLSEYKKGDIIYGAELTNFNYWKDKLEELNKNKGDK